MAIEQLSDKIVVITGASAGIGRSTAAMFAERGARVYGLSRSAGEPTGAKHIACDVTDHNSVHAAFDQIRSEAGRIDVLVLCAGYGISGAVETTPADTAAAQFDVNYLGAVRCINAAGEMLRTAKGTIVTISSLAAALPIPFQGHYSASKSALNSLSRVMSAEMRVFGVRCTAVLPGDIKTEFTARRVKLTDEVYTQAANAVAQMERDEQNGMPPERIARLIVKVSGKRRPRPFYTAGFGYKAFLLLSRLLPPALVDFLIRKIYLK